VLQFSKKCITFVCQSFGTQAQSHFLIFFKKNTMQNATRNSATAEAAAKKAAEQSKATEQGSPKTQPAVAGANAQPTVTTAPATPPQAATPPAPLTPSPATPPQTATPAPATAVAVVKKSVEQLVKEREAEIQRQHKLLGARAVLVSTQIELRDLLQSYADNSGSFSEYEPATLHISLCFTSISEEQSAIRIANPVLVQDFIGHLSANIDKKIQEIEHILIS
jgi:hypothetical protein